jgi:hypothetical protein
MTDPALLPVLQKLVPQKDGEPYTVHRSAVVDAVNADGTADILLSGVLIPSVPVVGNAPVSPGAAVSVLAWQGALLVLGEVATSVYDTGWVNVPLRAGFTHNLQLQVRRIGLVVYVQGRVTGSFTTANVIIGDIPVGFRPTTTERPAVTFDTSAARLGSAAIVTSGAINISAQTAGTATVNLYTSWLSA